jgi:hypothetical protein
VGYAPFYQGKNYEEIADPGFIPVPSFNPHAIFQQPTIYKGWSYFSGQPSLTTPVATTSSRQFAKHWRHPAVKQAIQCGRGPATMPKSRSSISERIAGGTDTKKNIWPFMVISFVSDYPMTKVEISYLFEFFLFLFIFFYSFLSYSYRNLQPRLYIIACVFYHP